MTAPPRLLPVLLALAFPATALAAPQALTRRTAGQLAVGHLSGGGGAVRLPMQTQVPPPAMVDLDADGLTSNLESGGWDIVIDEQGYGPIANGAFMTIRRVTCDPNLVDTDSDGLTDYEEWLIGSDPSSADTDGDSIDDEAEWNTWLTNLNSVDTDGDSRGPDHDGPPDPVLFDGLELDPATPRTSPTLEDTDGDGRTDAEELGHPIFSPVLAELPRASVAVVGDVDVRLDVEYAETVETTTGYEVSFSSSETSSVGYERSTGLAVSNVSGWEASATIGQEAGFESSPPESSYTASYEATFGVSGSREVTNEDTWTSSNESARSSEETYGQYAEDSRSFTETVATGGITAPLRVRNSGPSTFTLENLAITVLQTGPPATPGGPASVKALGTIQPDVPSLTLSPGEESPILTLDSGDMNADVVKGFLANPNSLVFQPSNFDLVNANGIDFDFITESTFSRTALVEIDFGDRVETFRVATNVDRDGFTYEGIRLDTVMTDILGIPFTTAPLRDENGDIVDGVDANGNPANVRVLTSVDGVAYQENQDDVLSFWRLIVETDLTSATKTVDGSSLDFRTIRLFGGSSARIVYTEDADGDFVWSSLEESLGTSDTDTDSDDDGLDDHAEAVAGWILSGTVDTYVFSDPRFTDTDQDGLGDAAEKAIFSDPTNPDTDGDGLRDGDDLFPLIAAGRLYAVSEADAGFTDSSAASWDSRSTLAEAFARANALNSNGNDEDDIAQIWVARGAHDADDGELRFHHGAFQVLGGFSIGDTVPGARDADPFTNQTVIYSSGDAPPTTSDAMVDFRIPSSSAEDAPAGKLDGFTLADFGGSAAAIKVARGHASFANLLVTGNDGEGGVSINSPATVDAVGCTFLDNATAADDGGGAVRDNSLRACTWTDCEFALNTATEHGGAYYRSDPVDRSIRTRFERCTFFANEVFALNADPTGSDASDADGDRKGGGAIFSRGGLVLVDCDFTANTTSSNEPSANHNPGVHGLWGGALHLLGTTELTDPDRDTDIVNCRFFGNTAGDGGAIYALADPGGAGYPRVNIVNSTIAGNSSTKYFGLGTPGESFSSGGIRYRDITFANVEPLVLRNTILWGNRGDGVAALVLPEETFLSNILLDVHSDTSFTTIEGFEYALLEFLGSGNNGLDPEFEAGFGGNLRLSAASPLIDTGFAAVDIDSQALGFQPLPATDLDGGARILDGDGYGGAQVDRGAYERQP